MLALLNWRRSWPQGGVALNALLREREWKTSNRAVFMRVWDERSFTRGVRVARVQQGVKTGSSGGLRDCNTHKPLANYGVLWAIAYWAHFSALKRSILVLLNAVISQLPTGLSAASRVFIPLRTG